MVALVHVETDVCLSGSEEGAIEADGDDKESLASIVLLGVVLHVSERVWLLSCDNVEVECARSVQDVDVFLGEGGRCVRVKVLVLEVQVELGASIPENRSEEHDEEKWEGDGPENVAFAAIPALEMSSDDRDYSAHCLVSFL